MGRRSPHSEARSRRRLGSFAVMVAPIGGVDRNPSEIYNGCLLNQQAKYAAGLAFDPDLLRRDPWGRVDRSSSQSRVRVWCSSKSSFPSF